MCKTRSKDCARTSCAAGNAASSSVVSPPATTTAATEQTMIAQPLPSLRDSCSSCEAISGATTQQQQQQQQQRVPVIAASDATTMRQILSRDQRTTLHRLIGTLSAGSSSSSSSSSSSANGAAEPRRAWCNLSNTNANTACFASAASSNRKRKTFDVEQQLQLQRTFVQKNSCVLDSVAEDVAATATSVLHCTSSENTTPHSQPSSNTYRSRSRSSSSNKSLIAFVTWLRLVGLALVALSLVSVESAPTAMTLESRRLDQAPKWLNPCGFAAEEFEGDLDVVQLNDATLLGNIVMQAKTALNYAHGFRDDYIKRTFNTDYADLHLTWKDNHYDWLPGPKQIPKKLGELLDQDYLHKLEVRMLDTALLDAYEYMQRYAVGLEQIAWDQEDYSLDFRKQFKETEYNLRSVLCELQMALAERGVTPRADVTRDVMAVEFRDMSESATYRNLRDWLIFRDYMNGLEYVVQVFEHFIRCFES